MLHSYTDYSTFVLKKSGQKPLMTSRYHSYSFVGNSDIRRCSSKMDLFISPNKVTEFVLSGLTQNPHFQKILFIIFLLIFLFTMVASLLTVITISLSPTLSASMYFFSSLIGLHRCLLHICYYP